MTSAVVCEKKNNLEYLLSLGAPIGYSLFDAALLCGVDILTILVDHGAALDGVDEYGNTAVECAILGKKKGNMEYLLNLGAPIGKKSLFFATILSDVDILTILVNHGLAIDAVNEDGDTAVAYAILYGMQCRAEYLLKLGAPLGKTALACAVICPCTCCNLELVRFVLAQNPKMIDEPRNGKTARQLAIAKGYLSIVLLLDSR